MALGLITLASAGEKSQVPRDQNLTSFEALSPVPDWTLPSLPLGKDTDVAFSLPFHQGSERALDPSGSQQSLLDLLALFERALCYFMTPTNSQGLA